MVLGKSDSHYRYKQHYYENTLVHASLLADIKPK